ncbi:MULTISPECIES: immunity 26/phosphotriesterase HocA family protein [unclassified Brenneria]|uniref:immunity 26/phosphotriesterase HocA family protein n=1 Tax=unclassified Brenneria TaxID=2634434 RepID=UPI0029C2AF8E|nr:MULTISPECIES: immunity 26/phosphotriesterase HocA family protein [unclassified Brenneria]MDX5631104.1 immunity 26/phosphotriesterase HocA family protein [Brenneria sp. L3-3Z]MDX5698177.1 immunity 26/phosphotriesterase HocA family protein [Brenneria sp. L4-2C]
MSNFKLWGWDKKPRTILRSVKTGDIFCFKLDDSKYCFGRIISKIITGHVAEIFNFISKEPTISENNINIATRITPPIVIDTYSLFDKKIEKGSDWRIIGHQHDYIIKDVDDVFFVYGLGNSCKKVDVFGNETSVSEKDAENYPELSPNGDYHVKILLKDI